jgi:thymidine phosphorylase
MVAIGRGMGKKVSALITDMEQPLGRACGNALETSECIEILRGGGPEDTRELSIELGAWMLHLSASPSGLPAARARIREALASGAGLEKFREVIALQGGDPRVCDDTSRLPRARSTIELRAERPGYVRRIACRAVGRVVMLLGGGRETVDGGIDPAVGLVLHKKVGDRVDAGESLATVHLNDRGREAEVFAVLREAFAIGDVPPTPRPLIHTVLDPNRALEV